MTNNSPQLSALTATTARRSYTLSYFDRPSSAAVIRYVHRLGCSKADFMEMASPPELQTFLLVSADNPGCGDSLYDDNYPLNTDRVVELVESFVAHWGLNRFLLVRGSMGGLVALLYAERNPSKIAGFVTVEGNLAPEGCMFSRSVIPHSYSHFEKVVFPQIKKALDAKTGPGFARHLQALEKANPRAYCDYFFQTVGYSDRGNLLDRFFSLPAPKCFLYGSQNRHLSTLQRLRESECALVEIPNANDLLFYDQPNHYAAALASLAQSSCSFPNPGTPISRLASSTSAEGEI
jgi:pimeloyl-ACP methyl ester carboxylesterase